MIKASVPDPIDVQVGHRIRLCRRQIGMSQTELGDRIGVTFQQVQKYEKGTNRVGASRLVRIAEVLRTSVQSLTDTSAKAEQSFSHLLSDPYALELLKSYNAISSTAVRRSVLDLVTQLKQRRLRHF